jgi:alpha-L-rhamnosidase
MEDVEHYERLARDAADAFAREFVTANGRVVSDTVTAIAICLVFDLIPTAAMRANAGERLVELVAQGDYRIQTGFVGTPLVCDALAQVGAIDDAYHLLLQDQLPSWLYPVSMGATTIWERWDSMLPNGEVNPGEMTSFNHYALGAVADFMHRTVAGLAPAAPGYSEILFAPQPGGGLTSARATHDTPHGRASISWLRDGGRLSVTVEVPPGARGTIRMPGTEADVAVGSGVHTIDAAFRSDELDPPRPILWRPHGRAESAA